MVEDYLDVLDTVRGWWRLSRCERSDTNVVPFLNLSAAEKNQRNNMRDLSVSSSS